MWGVWAVVVCVGVVMCVGRGGGGGGGAELRNAREIMSKLAYLVADLAPGELPERAVEGHACKTGKKNNIQHARSDTVFFFVTAWALIRPLCE